MKKLSDESYKSYNILETIKDLNIKLNKIDATLFSPFFNFIVNKYKNINLDLLTFENYNISKLDFNTQNATLYDYLIYLNNNKILHSYMNTYNNTQKKELENILNNKNFNKCCCWLNQYGKNLLDTLYVNILDENVPEYFSKQFAILDKDMYGHFTPLVIQKEIETKIKFKHKLSFSYNNIIINLNICKKNCKKINLVDLELLLKRIILLCNIKKPDKNINITIILCNHKKNIGKKNLILGPQECNSGFTSWQDPKIVIFRKEEVNKVIMHELIHFLNIDFGSIKYENFHNIVNINRKNNIILNESYTEILANIINCIIISYELIGKDDIKLCIELLYDETLFNLYNVAKILNYNNIKNIKDFFCKNKDNNYRENTAIFSYYIVKTSLLYSLNDFLHYLNNNFLKNNESTKNKFIRLVESNLKQKSYHKNVDICLNHIIGNKMLFKSLKMTLFEIKQQFT